MALTPRGLQHARVLGAPFPLTVERLAFLSGILPAEAEDDLLALADGVEFRVLDDGRRWLDITRDVALVVKLGDDDLTGTIAGLRKLASAAAEMAGALSDHRDAR